LASVRFRRFVFLGRTKLTIILCRPFRSGDRHPHRRRSSRVLPSLCHAWFRCVSLPSWSTKLTFSTLTEISLSAGPWGTGGIVEAGREKAVLYSYTRSRGFYAGIEALYVLTLLSFSFFSLFSHFLLCPAPKSGLRASTRMSECTERLARRRRRSYTAISAFFPLASTDPFPSTASRPLQAYPRFLPLPPSPPRSRNGLRAAPSWSRERVRPAVRDEGCRRPCFGRCSG
jgi:hypothetical protein